MNKFFACLLIFASLGIAQTSDQVLINKADLPPAVLAQLEQKSQVEKYGSYVGLGKEIGEAVKGSLSAFTDETDKFAKTGVGKFTMALVAYKVVGLQLIQLLFGLLLFSVSTFVIGFSFWKNARSKNVLESVDKDGKKTYRYYEASGDTILHHWLVWGIMTLLCVAIIFIH